MDLQVVRFFVEADDGSPPYALFEVCTALVMMAHPSSMVVAAGRLDV